MKKKTILNLGMTSVLLMGAMPWQAIANAQDPTIMMTEVELAERNKAKEIGTFQDGLNAKSSDNDKRAVEIWLPLAQNGHARAQFTLGYMYSQGMHFNQNTQKAVEWWEKAGNNGYTDAQQSLGILLYLGHPTLPKDARRAARWNEMAAKGGSDMGQLYIGVQYGLGDGVTKDYVKAKKYLEMSAAQGNAEAKTMLVSLKDEIANGVGSSAYLKGMTAYQKGDYKKARKVLEDEAKAGDAKSQFAVGEMYRLGQGVKWNYNVSGGGRYTHPDLISAIEILSKANEQGNAKAGYSLAFAYIYKNTVGGTKQVWLEATTWMKQSADRGNLEAQQQLAKEFLTGLNIIQSFPQAAYWNLRAAEQGDENAKTFLEFLLLSGSVTADQIPKTSSATELKMSAKELFFAGLEAGYNKKFTKAETLLLQSAKEGNVGAQAALGKMYYNGEGVPSSFENAYKWYEIAAGNGDVQSQYMMGYLWDSNATKDLALKLVLAGINVDRVLKAREWYGQAAANGHADAKIKLAALSSYTPVPPPPIKRGWFEQLAIDTYTRNEENKYKYTPSVSIFSGGNNSIYHKAPPRCYNIGNGMEQCFTD